MLTGRRARFADLRPHLLPEVELPAVASPKVYVEATTRGVGFRAQPSLALLPLKDHPGAAEVVVVKAVSDPASGQQGAASPLDCLLKHFVVREYLEDRERHVIDVPRIDLGPWVIREQR